MRLFKLARSYRVVRPLFVESAALSNFPSFHADASPQHILDQMQVFLRSPTQVQGGAEDDAPTNKPRMEWSAEMQKHVKDSVNSLGGVDSKALQPDKVLLGCGTLDPGILGSFLSFHAEPLNPTLNPKPYPNS